MIETQFAMNCNESCNDSALEVASPRHQPARLTPLDRRTIGSDHFSGSFGDQAGAVQPCPASVVAGFFVRTPRVSRPEGECSAFVGSRVVRTQRRR
jgi:hypothetical protein